eukprot:scaffold9329_cov23-Cyclotella_meneghiniana.AAC.1
MIPIVQNGVSNASQLVQQGESEDAPADYTGIVYIVWSTAGVAFLLLACYTYCVWRSISFAAANLNTGMTAVKANGCIFIMAYVSVALTWAYISAWFIAVIDVNDQTNIVDENVEVTENPATWTHMTQSVYTTKKDTPAEASPLPKDADGEPADPTIPYASIIGMLVIIARILPLLSTNVGATRSSPPRDTLRLSNGLVAISKEPNKQDPHCVRSRTGYVILLANCPILWKSKLQTEIALSTMEAEYVALSQSCKDLFPLLDQIMELASAVNLPVDKMSKMHVKIHEDNVCALTLGKLEPRRKTPRSKHYAIKYHWFREQIGPRNIQLEKVASSEQLGDIFTAGLSTQPFSYCVQSSWDGNSMALEREGV